MANELKEFAKLCILSALIVSAVPGTVLAASAQEAEKSASVAPANSASTADEYKIGNNDVLSVSIADAPEFSGKYRVNEAGIIEVTGVSAPIHAEGQTPIELAHSIRQALISAKQLRDPKVNVYVEEYRGRTITVLGAVSKPAVYPLQKRTTVLEALSMAGGALTNAGSTVTIMRGPASAEASGTTVGSVKIVDLSKLVQGEDVSGNVEVKNGDVVSLSSAQVVYVVGAVTKPGGFTMANPSEGISVIQAIALAEGFQPVASTRHALIIRQSTTRTARQDIPVDVAEMMSGKAADVILAPNDILYIPTSGAKKTLKVMGEVAMSAVNGVAIYGLGYRIGTRP
jgi:polysaccharide export outer membrane protein